MTTTAAIGEAQDAHWAAFGRRLSGLHPPLSPPPQAVSRLVEAIEPDAQHVLLLGATPALFALGKRVTMVDKCADTVARLWPGTDRRRNAVIGDWRWMDAPSERYTAVAGDGSLNALGSLAAVTGVNRRITHAAPGALAAVRSFVRPAEGETCEAVARAVRDGAFAGFHGFKLRLLLAAAHEGGQCEVLLGDVAARFDALFPDRAALASASGWSPATIAEIDAYRASPARLCFPTAEELREALGAPRDWTLLSSGTYEGAEHCPIVHWRIPG